MTINYSGFHAQEGTTTVHQFWGDIHNLTFRADKVIKTLEDLKEVCERFIVNKEAFDRTLYNTYPENIAANRIYESLIETEKSIEKIVFEYEGKTYCTHTTKHSVKRKIEKHADKITEHKTIFCDCLVNDRTEEIVARGEAKRELDNLLFADCF